MVPKKGLRIRIKPSETINKKKRKVVVSSFCCSMA
jgi:hypothetical protein